MRFQINDGFSQAAVDKVLLNGVEQKYCTMADAKLGAIERYKVDESGRILTIDDEPCMEEVNGKVQVTFREGWGRDEEGHYTLRDPKTGHVSTFIQRNGKLHET